MDNKILLRIAKAAAQLSKDDKAKIAAVAIANNRIISIGVNGYPAGYDDSDLEHKHDKVIHAEVNAILNCNGLRPEKMIIYGLPPCPECLKYMAAVGVKTVVWCFNSSIRSRGEWEEEFNKVQHLHNIYCLKIDEKDL